MSEMIRMSEERDRFHPINRRAFITTLIVAAFNVALPCFVFRLIGASFDITPGNVLFLFGMAVVGAVLGAPTCLTFRALAFRWALRAARMIRHPNSPTHGSGSTGRLNARRGSLDRLDRTAQNPCPIVPIALWFCLRGTTS